MSSIAASLQAKVEAMRQRALAGGAKEPDRCGRCDGTGWMSVQSPDGVARVTRCPCVFGSGDVHAPTVPFEFREAMLANYTSLPGNAAAIKLAKQWYAESVGDLYLHGGVGCGKTRLACSLLNEIYRTQHAGLFMRISGMLFSLQPSRSDVERDKFWSQLVDAPVLVLDDLGAERDTATDYTLRVLLQLHEERNDVAHRTIWTSNKDLNGLSQQMGDERLVSRIAGRAEIVKISAADQRVRSK